MKTVFKITENEILQTGDCIFILNHQLAKLDKRGGIEFIKNENIDYKKIDPLVLEDALKFKDIEPTYNNVANVIFAGDIKGAFISGEYTKVTNTDLGPTTVMENNLQLAVLSTATYIYQKNNERR